MARVGWWTRMSRTERNLFQPCLRLPLLFQLLTWMSLFSACEGGAGGEGSTEDTSAAIVKSSEAAADASTKASPSTPQASLVNLDSKQFQRLTIAETNPALAGSSVTIAPGSLAIDGSTDKSVVLIVEQGEPEAARKVQETLALENNNIEATAPALIVRPSAEITLRSSLILTIAAPEDLNLGLEADNAAENAPLQDQNLAVLFIGLNGSSGEVVTGVIPRQDIRIKFQANGKKFVTFKAKYFGLFQAARMSQPITESKEEVVESTQITIKNSEGTSVIDEQGQFTPLKEGESTLPSIPPESIDEVTFPAKDELAPTEPTLDTKAATSIAQYSLLLSSNIILNTDKGSSVGEITLKRDDSTGESPNPDASPEVSFELVGEDAAPLKWLKANSSSKKTPRFSTTQVRTVLD